MHVGYGALVVGHDDDDVSVEELGGRNEGDVGEWERRWQKWIVDLWVHPRQGAVKKIADRWWSRYGLLVLLPAILTVGWCSIPFPQYSLPYDDDSAVYDDKTPGHGRARVRVNFWFFLFVYYGPYNLTALMWITKVFNLYSLNW